MKIEDDQDREYFKVVETLLDVGADPDVVKVVKPGELFDFIRKFQTKLTIPADQKRVQIN